MAANPIFLEEAIEEFVDAVTYYETEAPPGTAQRLAFEANAIIQRVMEAPRRWPVEDNGYRRWRLFTFPYSWRFEVNDADEIRFVAFVHAKRRPGYFKNRGR